MKIDRMIKVLGVALNTAWMAACGGATTPPPATGSCGAKPGLDADAAAMPGQASCGGKSSMGSGSCGGKGTPEVAPAAAGSASAAAAPSAAASTPAASAASAASAAPPAAASAAPVPPKVRKKPGSKEGSCGAGTCGSKKVF